jgi:hypothetical protein
MKNKKIMMLLGMSLIFTIMSGCGSKETSESNDETLIYTEVSTEDTVDNRESSTEIQSETDEITTETDESESTTEITSEISSDKEVSDEDTSLSDGYINYQDDIKSQMDKINEDLANIDLDSLPETVLDEGIQVPEEYMNDEESGVSDYTIENLNTTLIAYENARIRKGPSSSSEVIGTVTQGDEVSVLGKVNEANWYMIEAYGKQGFISATSLCEAGTPLKGSEYGYQPDGTYIEEDGTILHPGDSGIASDGSTWYYGGTMGNDF